MTHINEAPGSRPGAPGKCVHAAKLNNTRDSNFQQGVNCVSHEAAVPYPASSQARFAAHAMLPARGVWERDDVYPFIVRSGDLRVIECKDGLQWILQRRRKNGKWRDLGYFRNRDVLIERSELAALGTLPPYYVRRSLQSGE